MKNTVTFCFVLFCFSPFLFFLLLALLLDALSYQCGTLTFYREHYVRVIWSTVCSVCNFTTSRTDTRKTMLNGYRADVSGMGENTKEPFCFCKQNLRVINGVICTKCDVRPQLFTCQISKLLETFYFEIVKCNLYTGVMLLFFRTYLVHLFVW